LIASGSYSKVSVVASSRMVTKAESDKELFVKYNRQLEREREREREKCRHYHSIEGVEFI